MSPASHAFARDVTVLICTYNRAPLLGPALDSLARTTLAKPFEWDVLVVDNNSRDETRDVVERRIAAFPVGLRYLFEPEQGKSRALNAGLALTTSRVIAFTDDDVVVDERWLEAGCRPLLDRDDLDYTGGPVAPIWERPSPSWLAPDGRDLWGTLAILDYGPDRFIFEDQRKVPLGANMAVTRDLIDRVGGFHPDLGRRGASLLGQEQAEFYCRSRQAGARGLYVPEMRVEHHVPARRLTRAYFRRWWFWKGVSRSRLERMHPTTELGLDLQLVPHWVGVPRYLFGHAGRNLTAWLAAWIRGSQADRLRHEVMLCYVAGYVWARQRDRAPSVPNRVPSPSAHPGRSAWL